MTCISLKYDQQVFWSRTRSEWELPLVYFLLLPALIPLLCLLTVVYAFYPSCVPPLSGRINLLHVPLSYSKEREHFRFFKNSCDKLYSADLKDGKNRKWRESKNFLWSQRKAFVDKELEFCSQKHMIQAFYSTLFRFQIKRTPLVRFWSDYVKEENKQADNHSL